MEEVLKTSVDIGNDIAIERKYLIEDKSQGKEDEERSPANSANDEDAPVEEDKLPTMDFEKPRVGCDLE